MNVLLPHSANLLSKIRDDVDAALKERGVSARQVSIDIAGHDGVIRDIRAGKMPGVDRVEALYSHLGLEFYLGPRRVRKPEVVETTNTDFVLVPFYDATLAAGSGSSNGDNAPVSELAFHYRWLRSISLRPEDACVARAAGDSMVPTIADGDMLLIDRSRTDIPLRHQVPDKRRQASVYAFMIGDQARVKRIVRPDRNTLILLSDNPQNLPEVLTGERAVALAPTIIGQVRWSGHTISDLT